MARILVIDDEPEIREMVRRMLERIGHNVTEASNGQEGIDRYRKERPDLVVMDIVMPDKEGLETIVELRDEFPEIKIIAISGGGAKGQLTYLSYAMDFGAIRTFTKPFDRKEFLKAVADLLTGSPGKDGVGR